MYFNYLDSEIRIRKEKDLSRIHARFLRTIKRWPLIREAQLRYEDIRQDLKETRSLNEKVAQFKRDWFLHVGRIETGRIPN